MICMLRFFDHFNHLERPYNRRSRDLLRMTKELITVMGGRVLNGLKL